MSLTLIERFTYGNSWQTTPQQREVHEVTELSPKRQRTIISLAKQQIESQQAVAHEIADSHLKGSQIVANEINRQTQMLDSTVQKIGHQISQNLFSVADQVSSALSQLGENLCMELSEIRWELAQQNNTCANEIFIENSRQKHPAAISLVTA